MISEITKIPLPFHELLEFNERKNYTGKICVGLGLIGIIILTVFLVETLQFYSFARSTVNMYQEKINSILLQVNDTLPIINLGANQVVNKLNQVDVYSINKVMNVLENFNVSAITKFQTDFSSFNQNVQKLVIVLIKICEKFC